MGLSSYVHFISKGRFTTFHQRKFGLTFQSNIFFVHHNFHLFFEIRHLNINSLQTSKLWQPIWDKEYSYILITTWFRQIRQVCNLKLKIFGHCSIVLEPQKKIVGFLFVLFLDQKQVKGGLPHREIPMVIYTQRIQSFELSKNMFLWNEGGHCFV